MKTILPNQTTQQECSPLMPTWFTAILTVCLIAAFPAMAGEEHLQAIHWPRELVTGTANLRINEVRLSLDCAEFRGVRNIPSDWNVEVVRPVSARAQMDLSAGHGASDLPNLRVLDGEIIIGGEEADCLDISATIITENGEIKLDKSKLGLVTARAGG